MISLLHYSTICKGPNLFFKSSLNQISAYKSFLLRDSSGRITSEYGEFRQKCGFIFQFPKITD